MPFCTQCGHPVLDTDRYCRHCGAQQPIGVAAQGQEPSGWLSPNAARILCYVPLLGWIVAVIVLASQRFSRDLETRFHAYQGLYLFVVWLLIDWTVKPLFELMTISWPHGAISFGELVSNFLKLGLFVVWIYMMVKTAQGERHRLPVVGELAERSVAEKEGPPAGTG